MKIKNLLIASLICLIWGLFMFTASSASAQVGRIEGDVVKAGTGEPIPTAEVMLERTDIKGSYKASIDKKGHFLHAGVPYVGTYAILVSAPGHQPFFLTGIRPTGEPIKIELQPGDGRKLTIDEVKSINKGGAPAAAAGAGGQQKQMTAAEQKKAQEEYEKKKAEIDKSKADHEGMKKIFDEGQALYANKDYNGAISKYNEAAKLDPDQQAIWGNLSIALYNRGVTNLNESLKDPSKKDPAKQDFNDSVAAATKAIALTEPQLNDPAKGVQAKKAKGTYLKIRADSQSLLARRLGTPEAADAAAKDYYEAASLSDDPVAKKTYPVKAAETLFEAGRGDEAIKAYQGVLQSDPDNLDALYNLGLAYANASKFQDSANTLQQFLDKAPANDQRVEMVKTVIKDLVTGNNLTPPKSEAGKGGAKAGKKKP